MRYVTWVIVEGGGYNGMYSRLHIVETEREGYVTTLCGRYAGIMRHLRDSAEPDELCRQCARIQILRGGDEKV